MQDLVGDDHPGNTNVCGSIWKVPLPLTPLIGREQDIADICTLLLETEVRLLTLLGPGGIGKTRLSFQLAVELRDAFAGGICFVQLAPVREPEQLMPAIAHELSLPETGLSTFEQVSEFLYERQVLLILDNFEQIVAAGPEVERLLSVCPALKVLVTSRAALRVGSEQLFVVSPLTLPDLKQPAEKEAIAGCAAVSLFVQRARAQLPSFDVTPANARILAEICIRLDGLPLAIELAAARIKLLPPQALLPRLSHRLQLLSSGLPTLPQRQQTLRNTLQWSYDLLDSTEQRLFRRLSVFVGGCTIEAAEALCAALEGEGSQECSAVLDVADALMEKSLLRPPTLDEQAEEPRLRMLEIIREYGYECLAASSEMEVTRQAHADYFLAFVEEVEPKLAGPEQAAWLNRLEHEHENLRVALEWFLERGEVEKALRFAGALRRFWLVRGHFYEGRNFLERVLASSAGVKKPVRATVLTAAANIALFQGDVDRAELLAEEALSLYALQARTRRLPLLHTEVLPQAGLQGYGELGDAQGIASALFQLERVARARGNLKAALLLSEEALALFKKADDEERVATALYRLARLYSEQGKYARACTLAEESLAIHRAMGNKGGIAGALFQLAHSLFVSLGDRSKVHALLDEALLSYQELGDRENIAYCLALGSRLALSEGEVTTARSLVDESIALLQEIGDQEGLSEFYPLLARVLTAQGDYAAAVALYKDCLASSLRMGNKLNTAICLEGMAQLVCIQAGVGEAFHGVQSQEHAFLWAAQLWGAAETLREAGGTPISPVDRAMYESALAGARTFLQGQAFDSAWTRGKTMSPDEALTPPVQTREDRSAAQYEATRPRSATGKISRTAPAVSSKAAHYPDELTSREVEVLRLLAQGYSDAQIAEQLIISVRTVNTHVTSVYRKIQVTSRAAATRYAVEHQLV